MGASSSFTPRSTHPSAVRSSARAGARPGRDRHSPSSSARLTVSRAHFAGHGGPVTGWTSDENNDYDYGLITLSSNLGNLTGTYGLASFSDDTLDTTTAYI